MEGEHVGEMGRETPSELGSSPTKRPIPWVFISLVILYWAVFLYSLYKNNCPSITPHEECLLHSALGRFSFQPIEQNMLFGPAMSTIEVLGGLKWNFKRKQTDKWHILSTIFFHAGLTDLILDTISLLYMGVKLEQNFGTVKIGFLYFLSSLGGSLWASLRFKDSLYVGGSSGVCGLTGGAVAEFFINLSMHEEKFKRFRSLCLGVAINFTIALFRGSDVTGNIGGLYFGVLFGFLLLIRCQREKTVCEHKYSGFDPQQLILCYSRYQKVLWVIALISGITQYLYSLIKYILR